jgi:hypothetical protein
VYSMSVWVKPEQQQQQLQQQQRAPPLGVDVARGTMLLASTAVSLATTTVRTAIRRTSMDPCATPETRASLVRPALVLYRSRSPNRRSVARSA